VGKNVAQSTLFRRRNRQRRGGEKGRQKILLSEDGKGSILVAKENPKQGKIEICRATRQNREKKSTRRQPISG